VGNSKTRAPVGQD